MQDGMLQSDGGGQMFHQVIFSFDSVKQGTATDFYGHYSISVRWILNVLFPFHLFSIRLSTKSICSCLWDLKIRDVGIGWRGTCFETGIYSTDCLQIGVLSHDIAVSEKIKNVWKGNGYSRRFIFLWTLAGNFFCSVMGILVFETTYY